MSIYKAAAVSVEPQTSLTQWRVIQIPAVEGDGYERHFVGYAGYEGRVSTAIQEFDKSQNCGITRSGRKYLLTGPSGFNGDAEYVLARWMGIHSLTHEDIKDVSSEYA